MVVMNVEDFAYGVLMEALPSIPADVLEVIADDIDAGEYLMSLIELIERAPETVSVAVVDALEGHLETLPEGPHRRVGADAVARLRHLKSA